MWKLFLRSMCPDSSFPRTITGTIQALNKDIYVLIPDRSVSLLNYIFCTAPPSLAPLMSAADGCSLSAALGHLVAGSTCGSGLTTVLWCFLQEICQKTDLNQKTHSASIPGATMTSPLDIPMFAKCLGVHLWWLCCSFVSLSHPAWGDSFTYSHFIVSLPQLFLY